MTTNHIDESRTMVIQGRKDDSGKLRFDLVPPDALAELVHVYTVGSARYKPRNWETGISYSRCFAALQRHSWAIWAGEDIDPEDGIPHSAKVAWYGLALSAFRLRGMTHLDDRPTTPQMPTWDDVTAAADDIKKVWESGTDAIPVPQRADVDASLDDLRKLVFGEEIHGEKRR